MDFCNSIQCSPLPLQQDCLIRFVAHLAQSGVCYSSICVYLNGVRFYHVSHGFPNPHLNDDLVLQYVLRGVHRSSPIGSVRPLRVPVTLDMLRTLWSVWLVVPSDDKFDAAMLWAACCLGFFGFLRAGEFTCPSWQAYTTEMLSPRDVTVDSHDSLSIVSVLLRRSKTDPFGAGVTIHLGRTNEAICPVGALLSYLALRGLQPGPLFLFRDSTPLSSQRLLSRVHLALSSCGHVCTGLTGHSFRIGAATAAARAGMEDSLIQALGRWRSDSYLRYIRSSPRDLAAASRRLVLPAASSVTGSCR